jgi:trehalose 6-phosphate phosphatase
MELVSESAQERYDALLAHADGLLVGLDFDGTLAPIVEDPERAFIHPAAADALAEVAACVQEVAIITGRPVAQVLRLGDLEALADRLDSSGRQLVVLGQYGNETWDSTSRRTCSPEPPPGLARLRAELPQLLEEADAVDAWVEEKGLAVGVHTRRTDEPQATYERVLPVLSRAAEEHGLTVEPGRLIVEVRAGERDKGDALRDLVAERGATAVAFLGDDLGDLPAFTAVEDLRRTGTPGLLVCSASTEQPALRSHADVVVDGPDGVVSWLRQLAQDLRR